MRLVIDKNTSIPVYLQLANYLREQILTGVYKEGFRFPSESDFSANLGINHQTLRKSFRILAEENLIKQQRGKGTFVTFQTEATYKIAILGYMSTSPASALWLSGLYEAFSNIKSQFIYLPYLQETHQSLKEAFIDSKADALLLYAQTPQILQQLSDPFFSTIPCVAINAKSKEAENCFCIDVSPNPIRPAIEHLAKLGHKRIGFITSGDKTSNLLERENSFWSSLKEFNLDCSKDLMAYEEGHLFDASMKCALKLVKQANPVTAIICPGPTITYGAVYSLMKEAIRIPEDISIVGYDIPTASNPYISTLTHPQHEMAFYAGKVLSNLLTTKKIKKKEIFQVLFKERGSTSKPNKSFCYKK